MHAFDSLGTSQGYVLPYTEMKHQRIVMYKRYSKDFSKVQGLLDAPVCHEDDGKTAHPRYPVCFRAAVLPSRGSKPPRNPEISRTATADHAISAERREWQEGILYGSHVPPASALAFAGSTLMQLHRDNHTLMN